MKRLIAIAAMLAAPTLALATNQQVDPDEYRSATRSTTSGRSDGLYYTRDTKIPVLIGNGDGIDPIGPTYTESFGYGAGLGLLCESYARTGTTGFSTAASANAACNTTCGNSACVMAFEAALADAGDILDCADSSADACLCQTTSLDQILLGCGANWEAPALGITNITFASGVKLAHVSLLAQDIGPAMDANGLDISGDLTDNDGNELIGGMYGASGRPLVPGVDPAFKFCVDFAEIADVSGTDELWVGFRDTTAPNATFNSYNSYAVIGVISGNVTIETEDDGGGTTTTDTTDDVADGGSPELCVLVSDAGAVTYTLDGSAPTTTASYSLDSGEPVIPFVHFLHATTSPGEIVLDKWEVTYQ